MKTPILSVSICIPAYNEGKNISHILRALLNQQTKRIVINKIVVVSSGSTDNTESVTRKFQKSDSRIHLICQRVRAGKAAAINAFLKTVDDSVVVIESADTIPLPNTIELLCVPFLENDQIGMTGGAPIPLNDEDTFIGSIVHTWWWFHRHIPRFGEIIAYRNLLPQISPTTAVDEAYIQAKLIQLGFKAVHVDTAVINNKGPETLGDLIKQRRRIFNGHSRLFESEGVKINNMTKSSLKLLFTYRPKSFKHFHWLLAGIAFEFYARLLGAYDIKVKKLNPFVWDTATTTKYLSKHQLSTRQCILFLNFAPLSFGGGAERWLLSVASSVSKKKDVEVLQVHPRIANIYARFVLKSPFSPRLDISSHRLKESFITWKSLLPFSYSWTAIHRQLKRADLIYTKLELNELLIILYFGGFATLKKTIIGLHSPFEYTHPLSFFERLHNVVYSSSPIRYLLSKTQAIHALNTDQELRLSENFGLSNTIHIPNFIEIRPKLNLETGTRKLRVCFVGELSVRKGADILLKVMQASPSHFSFDIAGDGNLKSSFLKLNSPHAHYHGYLDHSKVDTLMSKADVLLLPSRAESFSLSSLEALSHGLVVVCAAKISPPSLDKFIVINNRQDASGYLRILHNLYRQKMSGVLKAKRQATADQIKNSFSKSIIHARLQSELFNLGT